MILRGINPTQILALRMSITTVALMLTVWFTGPGLFRMPAHGRNWSMILGVNNAAGMICYFWALARIDASVAAMLMAVAPIIVLTILALNGEPVTKRHIVRMALALSGLYLLIGPGGNVDPIGVLLIGGSMITYSVNITLTQWHLGGYDARASTLFNLISMTVTLFLFWFFQGAVWTPLTSTDWLLLIVLALVSTYAARLAFFYSIKAIGGGQVSMLSPVETVLTVFWSMLFLGERLTTIQWLGGLLVLSSALLAIQRLKRASLPVRWRLWAKQP
jgi:drug/metabolite transporter (DMT)-like permease